MGERLADQKRVVPSSMVFLEPVEYAMIVMDGNRPVAKARRKGTGQWLLSLEGASWADTMTNEARKAWLRKIGLRPNYSPWIKVVGTKAQARKELKLLAFRATHGGGNG